jgi:HSP20 family protein
MGSDFTRLMHSLFPPGALPVEAGLWRPAVDIYRTRDGWLLKFDLAGVHPDDVRLQIQRNQLTVHGTRRDFCLEEGCCHFQMEISYSRFERTVTLPVDLDLAHITQDHRYGMLLVRISLEGTAS